MVAVAPPGHHVATPLGKSATGNTILGKKEFKSSALMMSVTTKCKRKTAVIGSRQVQVIDTPGLFDTTVSHEKIREEIGKCITMSSPGPHVFLLLLTVGRFTQEERETVKMIQEIFGEYSKAYTMVGFTRGEELRDEGIAIEKYIEKSPPALQELIKDCSGRYHVFCNKDKDTQAQQIKLTLEKKLRNLRGEAVKERDEDIKRLEELRANLEKNHEKKINEIDSEVFTELARSRAGIRRRAEKAEAKAMAKSLQHNQQKCTIS
ncbi:GTPase IMAP family member 7-like [Clupea harengus]|uniref:GTPase IMAP family member 7-like n=1 Tax=Clupea harengus TaxID=7950 RepID=A0A8M1KHL9_CLUHA|nr:GTPase IMAP family member 7-like [Clupea harengus]